jgi:hypothetical protein
MGITSPSLPSTMRLQLPPCYFSSYFSSCETQRPGLKGTSHTSYVWAHFGDIKDELFCNTENKIMRVEFKL